MKILSQEETCAIIRPRCTSMNALHPKEEDYHVAANAKEESFVATESIGRKLRRNEATEFVRAGAANRV